MTSDDISSRLELARSAAREAGELTLGYFQVDDLAVELKRDQSPVTIADRQAETLLRERIAASRWLRLGRRLGIHSAIRLLNLSRSSAQID